MDVEIMTEPDDDSPVETTTEENKRFRTFVSAYQLCKTCNHKANAHRSQTGHALGCTLCDCEHFTN